MALLPPDHVAKLSEMFAVMSAEVTLVQYTQRPSRLVLPEGLQCATCRDTDALLTELADLSDKIVVETHDFSEEREAAEAAGVDKIPAIIVQSAVTGGRVRFFGMPAGYEFASFVEDLIDAGGESVELDEPLGGRIAGLDSDVHIQVFVSPACPYCPGAVRVAHRLAMAGERVTADCVMAGEFPHLTQKYAVMGVPRTVVNETVQFEGALPLETVVEKVVEAATAPA